ncbi:hypothetical protein BJ741DRAFT_148963 [Chytriomyces cf. hyalinus JEL632]|nr:hypothetical protein BJ741DRAFT_148963 [Chytriomyces cf. hyalinus JEL632]
MDDRLLPSSETFSETWSPVKTLSLGSACRRRRAGNSPLLLPLLPLLLLLPAAPGNVGSPGLAGRAVRVASSPNPSNKSTRGGGEVGVAGDRASEEAERGENMRGLRGLDAAAGAFLGAGPGVDAFAFVLAWWRACLPRFQLWRLKRDVECCGLLGMLFVRCVLIFKGTARLWFVLFSKVCSKESTAVPSCV